MNPKKLNSVRSGFTLIELLTVIAIIGILAAIIIPTVGSVRNKAKGVRCTSNLRQIGLAIRTFANDNKGMMVPYRGEPTSAENPTLILWTEYLVSYMSIKTPDGKMPTLADGADYKEDSRFFYMCPASPVPVNWRAWGNYALHPVVMKQTNGKPNFAITKVKRPSQLILIADGSVFTGAGLNGGASDDNNSGQFFSQTYPFTTEQTNILNAPVVAEGGNPNTDGTIGWFRYRHNNSVNCLYLDGHVAAIPFASRSKDVTYSKFVFSR